ncbi:MAG: hypothetical protein IB618_03500 [Candidatus Pacearchaeota archaeon]|nr:MAG: hypothetical protein IB618_03500 [Candidatus Pacearchaeota archaeon]
MVDGYGGWYAWTDLYGIIQQWEAFGVFTILFPLVLVFAVVFAILEKVDLFKNRGVHLLIALIIGFFTVSNPYVGGFFMYFFSNLGIGVAIMLALIVLLGIALKPGEQAWKVIFGIVGGAVFLVILARSGTFKWIFGENFWYWIQANSALVVVAIVVILMIVAVMTGVKKAQVKGKII